MGVSTCPEYHLFKTRPKHWQEYKHTGKNSAWLAEKTRQFYFEDVPRTKEKKKSQMESRQIQI